MLTLINFHNKINKMKIVSIVFPDKAPVASHCTVSVR